MRIILDTNFLLYCAEKKIDYISECPVLGEFIVLSSVISELKNLKKNAKTGSDKKAAELALQILGKNIEDKKIKIEESMEEADKAIQKMAGKQDAVATMDKELKEKLKGKARILCIRQGKKLELW